MDRFALCLSLGYVDAQTEVDVLTAQELGHPLAQVGADRVIGDGVLVPCQRFAKESASRLKVAEVNHCFHEPGPGAIRLPLTTPGRIRIQNCIAYRTQATSAQNLGALRVAVGGAG